MRDIKRHDRKAEALRKEIAALERLERRGGMTLVLNDGALITAYHMRGGGKR